MEKVDDAARFGEEPGTPSYAKRAFDAVPDEIEIIPEEKKSRRASQEPAPTGSLSTRDSPIPKTKVEKIDPASPSLGDVPGTEVWRKHLADAVPDFIEKIPEPGMSSPVEPTSRSQAPTTIPKTVITRVDSEPRYGEEAGTKPKSS